ncbi:MAG: ABC transporter permease [Candidatus Omnitrophica bacterium]|nr:ABC transporter permease [Candidatus Omnitrophota bacterium]
MQKIYEPFQYLKAGIRIWPLMVRDIIDHRELISRLFWRNLISRYKQSLFGQVWIVLMPLLMVGTFAFLKKTGVFQFGATSVPYPLFALTGLIIWQVFSTGLITGCSSLVSAGDMISKINFPRESLVFASLAQAVLEFIIKLVLLAIFLVIFNYPVTLLGIILFLITVIPIFILTLGLSLFFSLVTGIFRDTVNILSVLVTLGMFLSPVVYPLKISNNNFWLQLNLLTPLIDAPRDALLLGKVTNWSMWGVASIFSILVFLVAWRVFYIAETKIAERI